MIGPGAWFYELLAAVGVPSDAGAAGSRTAVRDRETLSDQYIPCASHARPMSTHLKSQKLPSACLRSETGTVTLDEQR